VAWQFFADIKESRIFNGTVTVEEYHGRHIETSTLRDRGGDMWVAETFDAGWSSFFEKCARALLSLLIVAILLAVLAGVVYTFYDLRLIFSLPFHAAFKTILVDILTVLAIVEILRTALAYFSEGRVKVTYIIDTVMVTVLTEVMAFWYKEMPWQQLAMVIMLTLSLALIRVVAVRYSPRSHRDEL
jgi:uncharacterized membrane protein (DUF373 family)